MRAGSACWSGARTCQVWRRSSSSLRCSGWRWRRWCVRGTRRAASLRVLPPSLHLHDLPVLRPVEQRAGELAAVDAAGVEADGLAVDARLLAGRVAVDDEAVAVP